MACSPARGNGTAVSRRGDQRDAFHRRPPSSANYRSAPDRTARHGEPNAALASPPRRARVVHRSCPLRRWMVATSFIPAMLCERLTNISRLADRRYIASPNSTASGPSCTFTAARLSPVTADEGWTSWSTRAWPGSERSPGEQIRCSKSFLPTTNARLSPLHVPPQVRSEEHTSELQSQFHLV